MISLFGVRLCYGLEYGVSFHAHLKYTGSLLSWIETMEMSIKLVYGIQVFCVLTDFVLSITKRGVQFSNYSCGFIYFSFRFCQFCFLCIDVDIFLSYLFIYF